MFNKETEHLILVEGQTDKDFFLALVNKRLNFRGNKKIEFKVPKDIIDPDTRQPLKTGGKEGVKKGLEILLATPLPSTIKSVFAIVDADDDYSECCRDFKMVFKQAGYPVRVRNNVAKQNGLFIGFFIVGQEEKYQHPQFQDLETLLFQIRTYQAEDSIVEMPLRAFEQFRFQHFVSHPDKSKMSIYLAHLPKFSNHFGEALKNNYFNSSEDTPELAFLDNLLNHIKPADADISPTP
ncbi:MAG: DUF3226 domain-containing protein [Candidatus Melainabacteria bacterium]|nr:DUF3226 domain-containing protein [Candidatus Melainabacteria bacterium]